MKKNKTPKQGQEGVHLDLSAADELHPMRRDVLPYDPRGPALARVGYGFESVMDFGKGKTWPYQSPSRADRTTKGTVAKYPEESESTVIPLQPGIPR